MKYLNPILYILLISIICSTDLSAQQTTDKETTCNEKVLAPLKITYLDENQVHFNIFDYKGFDDFELLARVNSEVNLWVVVPEIDRTDGTYLNSITTANNFSFEKFYDHNFLIMTICDIDTLFTKPVQFTYHPDFFSEFTNSKENNNCCTNLSDEKWVVLPETSGPWPSVHFDRITFDANLIKSNFLIYPQPAKEFIYLKNTDDKMMKSVSIFDLQGKKIVTNANVNSLKKLQVEISNLVSGLYLIDIELDNKVTYSKKITIQK